MGDREPTHTSSRGFASMDEQKQRDIASRGGRASGGNFKNNPERAAAAGRKGGRSVPAGERSFSRDHQLAAEAGRKGGTHSHGARHAAAIGSRHDSGPARGADFAKGGELDGADRPASGKPAGSR